MLQIDYKTILLDLSTLIMCLAFYRMGYLQAEKKFCQWLNAEIDKLRQSTDDNDTKQKQLDLIGRLMDKL